MKRNSTQCRVLNIKDGKQIVIKIDHKIKKVIGAHFKVKKPFPHPINKSGKTNKKEAPNPLFKRRRGRDAVNASASTFSLNKRNYFPLSSQNPITKQSILC